MPLSLRWPVFVIVASASMWSTCSAADSPAEFDDSAAVGHAAPPKAEPQKPELSCLEEPKHWSAVPEFSPGLQLIFSRYVRFTTKTGRVLNARIFFVELDPERAAAQLPAPARERAKSLPPRLLCLGHEIAVDDGFEPDYVIPKNGVTGNLCTSRLELDDVTSTARTTNPEQDQ